MLETFATPSSGQVASLFDDEAGMLHGVEGHHGPDGDAGVAHGSAGPQDQDGLMSPQGQDGLVGPQGQDGSEGPQGQDVEDPNTHTLQPDQLLLIGKCVYMYIPSCFV
jgi:hypothetical protein